jgi:hypothetical protein
MGHRISDSAVCLIAKFALDRVKAVITRSHAAALLIAEAAAPERQMKRTLSLIAANAATIFHRQSASRAVHGGIHRLQNRS